jgi:hypothetical protein
MEIMQRKGQLTERGRVLLKERKKEKKNHSASQFISCFLRKAKVQYHIQNRWITVPYTYSFRIPVSLTIQTKSFQGK